MLDGFSLELFLLDTDVLSQDFQEFTPGIYFYRNSSKSHLLYILTSVHSKRWSKSAFSKFLVQKAEKSKKIEAKQSKNVFEIATKRWSMVLFPTRRVSFLYFSSFNFLPVLSCALLLLLAD